MNRINLLRNGLVAALLLAAAGTTAQALDVAIAGRLTDSSPNKWVVRPGCHYFTYRVDLKAGETTVFELQSKEFDAYLILLDDQNRIVAQDDDSGGGTNAKIVFGPKFTGKFTIVVTTNRAGAKGNYVLDISADYE